MYKNTLIKCFTTSIIALFLHQTAKAESLEGTWQHNNRTTTIRPTHHFKLIFCNEDNQCAEGYYENRYIVRVPQWNVSGRIRGNNLIAWNNGTQWVRTSSHHHSHPNIGPIIRLGHGPALNGRWFHNGKPTTIRMRGGNRFLLINEEGASSEGYIKGHELILPDLQIRGQLRKGGRVIRWSNGTTWRRN